MLPPDTRRDENDNPGILRSEEYGARCAVAQRPLRPDFAARPVVASAARGLPPGVFATALATVARFPSGYDRAYYAGIAWERRAKARYRGSSHGAHDRVYEWIAGAMELFEEAERLRGTGNDDAILRWNACVRFLGVHKEVAPRGVEVTDPIVSE